jgi:hypothetical protein
LVFVLVPLAVEILQAQDILAVEIDDAVGAKEYRPMLFDSGALSNHGIHVPFS